MTEERRVQSHHGKTVKKSKEMICNYSYKIGEKAVGGARKLPTPSDYEAQESEEQRLRKCRYKVSIDFEYE